VSVRKGADPASVATENEARKFVSTGKCKQPSKSTPQTTQVFPAAYDPHRGRSRTPIVRVVPDDTSGLYRVAWPDIGLSDLGNLTRCKQAAREWTESKVLTDLRKKYGVGALKMLNNFSWSASGIRQNGGSPTDDHNWLDWPPCDGGAP
jgi:hypothetical protein